MPHEVIMPALGMAQDAGRLVAWLKKPGDPIAEGDALFEVETDKATMEVEAQAPGFLTDVRAAEGDDVPVGRVIARISETAETAETAGAALPEPSAPSETAKKPPASAPPDDLPEGRSVILPALGMAQDTGLLVAWHVSPGEEVAEGDVLFEVETDKTTMEVSAEAAGFVAAILAEDGEEVPVGERVAILTAEKPTAPVRRKRSAAGVEAPQSHEAPAAPKETPATERAATPPVATGGRILASPKARRLALEEGLDLARLVEAGHPQPFHVRDLEALKTLQDARPATAAAAAQATRRITADIHREGFSEFLAWAAESEGHADAPALLAAFAAASFRSGREHAAICVIVERFGEESRHLDPDRAATGRSAVPDEDAPAPDLILRDLRHVSISSVELGAEDAPVLTIMKRGEGLAVTLECGAGHLSAAAALELVSGFTGRLEEPLRHLL